MASDVRFTLIDESVLADHVRLGAEDKCLFLYEYTSGRNYSFSATNGLISNLKKKPGSSANEIYYKNKAIRDVATAFRTGTESSVAC